MHAFRCDPIQETFAMDFVRKASSTVVVQSGILSSTKKKNSFVNLVKISTIVCKIKVKDMFQFQFQFILEESIDKVIKIYE